MSPTPHRQSSGSRHQDDPASTEALRDHEMSEPSSFSMGVFCHGCEYNLRGCQSTKCPECGRPFDPKQLAQYYLEPATAKPITRRELCIRVVLISVLIAVPVSIEMLISGVPVATVLIGLAVIVGFSENLARRAVNTRRIQLELPAAPVDEIARELLPIVTSIVVITATIAACLTIIAR